MQFSTTSALVFAALLGAASASLADGLSARIWNEGKRGHVEVKGSAAQFPDGTELRVEVVVKGNFSRPMVGAFFRARVQGGQFVQEETRPAEFPPLSYTVKLKLQVNNQAPPVRKLIEQKFGWPRSHTEELDFADVTVGTEAESARFRLEILRRLLALSEELIQVVNTLEPGTAKPIADNPDWEATHTAFVKQARVLGGKVRRFSREFAVLPDQDLLDTLSNSLNKLSAIAQHMEKGLDPAGAQRDLGYVRRWSTGLHADVNGRLPVEERVGLPGARPKDPGEDEDPEDEDPEDEDR
ncbi:MAG: hypothetical protein KDD82_29185 [Planctomycetes bacterium]|nr:hypothetical protein [Planctomycetota bacterium]